jgi:hypothetical protein
MRRSLSLALLIILAISLFLSLGFVQSASARKPIWKPFYFIVDITTGEAESSLWWLEGYNVYPIYWWGDPERSPFPPEEYWGGPEDGFFVCHGDWCMGCVVYDGNFRYQWWIYWTDDPYINPYAQCAGGYFTFSEGSGDFAGMEAYGIARVKWPYQYHFGLIYGEPE